MVVLVEMEEPEWPITVGVEERRRGGKGRGRVTVTNELNRPFDG